MQCSHDSLPLDRAQFVIVHMYDFGVLYGQSQSHGEEVYGQDKKDAHLTANMGSHLFSLFQALLPEQFALPLNFVVVICTAVKIKLYLKVS